MVNLLKKFLVVFFLLSINQSVMAKPVPPGSGEGDVPANILILLDNSKSMKNNKIGLGLENAHGVTIDGSGNKIISSSGFARGGLFKFDSAGFPLAFLLPRSSLLLHRQEFQVHSYLYYNLHHLRILLDHLVKPMVLIFY